MERKSEGAQEVVSPRRLPYVSCGQIPVVLASCVIPLRSVAARVEKKLEQKLCLETRSRGEALRSGTAHFPWGGTLSVRREGLQVWL